MGLKQAGQNDFGMIEICLDRVNRYFLSSAHRWEFGNGLGNVFAEFGDCEGCFSMPITIVLTGRSHGCDPSRQG